MRLFYKGTISRIKEPIGVFLIERVGSCERQKGQAGVKTTREELFTIAPTKLVDVVALV